MPEEFPQGPSLEHLRKQAKALLKLSHARNPEAARLLGAYHPAFRGHTSLEILGGPVQLCDTQLAIARQYGFSSWPELKIHIDSLTGGASPAVIPVDTSRIPDPGYRGQLAAQKGLPPVGTVSTSRHGVQYRVVDHGFAMTHASLARAGDNDPIPMIEELLPIISFSGMSRRLTDFYVETDCCTSKQLVFMDSMPGIHPGSTAPGLNQVVTTQDPRYLVFHLDAANLHETILAHELGHVWLEMVEGCEDQRFPRSYADLPRVFQLECIQSFVLDLRVNVLLQGRGFDMAVIDGEQWEGIRDIAAQCERGSRPRTARTAAALINVVAAAMLEYGRWPRDAAQNFHSCLMKIRTALPEVYRAAEAFATSVERHGVADREAICRVIDECARVSFRAAGDDFDPERDVVEEPHREWMYDKHPDFLPGLPVSRKLAIWRAMAKRGIGPRVRCRILPIGRSDLVITVADASGRQPAPARLTLHVPAAEVGAGALQRSIRPRERPERASPIGVPEIPAWSVHAGPPPMAEPQPSLAVLAWDSAGVFLDQQFPRGARSYMPGIGRWLSRVGFEDDDDEEQPYAYAENNPVVRTNPAGNAPVLYPSPTPAVSPPYPGNPTWWGPGDQSRWLCNCYAYAMNYSGGMVPPGLYSGFKYRDCPPKNGKNIASCTNLVANAVRDGLQKISAVAPCPSGWHKVVLFASDSDCDFHWYRENPDGSWWSKQPEQNAVECTTNPSEDARRQGYPVFCGTLCGPNTFVPPKPPKGRKR